MDLMNPNDYVFTELYNVIHHIIYTIYTNFKSLVILYLLTKPHNFEFGLFEG